ncbi:MAG: hypothetical protein ABL933_18715 [Methyloglobulus sp.]|nr:hypothetical protein [Methyloglobulus sp.]
MSTIFSLNYQKTNYFGLSGTVILSFALLLTGASQATYAQLKSGDIIVADSNAGTENAGSILQINALTGIRTSISDFGDASQGESGGRPVNLVIESAQNILVLDYQLNKLFRVDSSTGRRTLLSDFNDPAQGLVPDNAAGNAVLGIAIEKSGAILITAKGVGTNFRDAILRVDRVTGQRTMLSDFGDPTQGVVGGQCAFGLAVETSGKILATDCDNFGSASSGGLLFRIDPITGTRALLSDFGNAQQGGLTQSLGGIALESSGHILVVAPFAGTSGGGALYRVHPSNGQRTLLNDFGNALQGPTGALLRNVAVESADSILVVDQDVDDFMGPGVGAVFRINPLSGQRTILSDFGNVALGSGSMPFGLVVMPSSATNTVPFNVFSTELTLSKKNLHKDDWFVARGSFKIGGIPDGINPSSEDVAFSISDKNGYFFNQTLSSGSFKALGKSRYMYKAIKAKSGISMMTISATNVPGQYTYFALAKALILNREVAPSISVSLKIGNDEGSAKIGCRNLPRLLICRR